MKFPRNTKIFHGQIDIAPLAGVFFLLVLFVLLASLVYTPGVKIDLPAAGDLPGLDQTTVAVAVDAGGNYYYDNQIIASPQLLSRLRSVARKSDEPLCLLVQADRAVTYAAIVHLSTLARDAGLKEVFLATQPGGVTPPELISQP